jgi:hypothetical protein
MHRDMLIHLFQTGIILLLMPVETVAQARYWESWNTYPEVYNYGLSTTYVNMRSKVEVSLNPRIYSFEARISEEGVSPEQEYKLLVNCTTKSTMYLGQDSTNKWIKATGKFLRIVTDACR